MSLTEVKSLPISALKSADYNPRKISKEALEQLKLSLKKFTAVEPAIINSHPGRENVIVGGHQRLKAAKELGWFEFPCIVVNLAEPEERELNVRLNKNTGEFDMPLLKEFFEKDDLLDWGFSDDELGNLFDEEITGLTDPDEIPEPPANPITVIGDVWILGNHRLMCGDSTSIDEIQKLCAGNLVDMWLTDPPYNVAYEGKTKDALKIQNDSMGNDQFRQFLRDCYVAADVVMKPGAVFYIWHADSEGYNFRGAAKDANWTVRQCLIWKKSCMVMGRQDYQWKHEPCLYGWKEGAGHLWASDRKQTTILEFDKPNRNAEHPTMKPVELFEYQMLNNTKGGDIILDSFGGSGTTLIAAEKNGRIARLMELDPKYCDVIIKRWQDFSGKKAVLESNGKTFEEVSNEARA